MLCSKRAVRMSLHHSALGTKYKIATVGNTVRFLLGPYTTGISQLSAQDKRLQNGGRWIPLPEQRAKPCQIVEEARRGRQKAFRFVLVLSYPEEPYMAVVLAVLSPTTSRSCLRHPQARTSGRYLA
ncbi:hypothetical protein GY45DRAFT_681663 [Cubamyces sp. BRFM 1775]|nr:hypothetical protein GY45DRAFT_681663 [Cubamyces sp. BRFM 1775]